MRRPSRRRLGLVPACLVAAFIATGGWLLPSRAATTAPAPVVTWTRAAPSTSPPALEYAAAAYDASNDTMVLFGGTDASGSLSSETWVWDGGNWTHQTTPASCTPPARRMAAMAFDPASNPPQLVLFGGQGQGGVLLSDTWTWNGACWFEAAQGATAAPPAREAAAMSFDRSGNLVLFGGTGAASTSTPPSTSAAPSTGVAAATGVEKVLGDTWIWNGSTWTAGPTGPPPRSGAALAYDSADRVSVLFSGSATPADSGAAALTPDTWTWDGSHWSRAATPVQPPARTQAIFATAPAAAGVLLLDGAGSSGALSDAWLWSSSAGWTEARTAGGAVARSGAAATADTSRKEVTVFGGVQAGGGSLGDTDLVTASLPPAPTPTTPAPAPPTTNAPTTTTKPTTVANPGKATPTPTTAPKRPSTTTTTTVPASSLQAASGTLSLRASTQSVRPGAQVRLAGAGFAPGSVITLSFHSLPVDVGEVVADPSGAFAEMVTVPRDAAAGLHHFEAAGIDPARQATRLTATVYVLSPGQRGGVSGLVTAAMVALALAIPGGAWLTMIFVGRRRVAAGRAG